MTKSDIRSRMKLLQAEMSESYALTCSEKIIGVLQSMPEFQSASTLLSYSSLPGEVNTSLYMDKWAESKRVVLPVVLKDSSQILLREYDKKHLQRGYANVLEPQECCRTVRADEVDFALIPGLAFAKCSNGKFDRLGRGKGFYDRLLPLLKCRTVGLCFPFALIDSIPTDEWDVKIDYCIQVSQGPQHAENLNLF